MVECSSSLHPVSSSSKKTKSSSGKISSGSGAGGGSASSGGSYGQLQSHGVKWSKGVRQTTSPGSYSCASCSRSAFVILSKAGVLCREQGHGGIGVMNHAGNLDIVSEDGPRNRAVHL